MKTFDEVMELTRTVSSNTALEDPECRALYECCLQVPYNGKVVEIGCELGRSSSILLQMAKQGRFQTTHIDPYLENPEYLRRWITMMHSIEYPFIFMCAKSEYVARKTSLDSAVIDLLFVDGDHEFTSVRYDLGAFASCIRPGGILACHDYGRDSLPDVYHAVNHYLSHHEWDQITLAGTLGVWRKK